MSDRDDKVLSGKLQVLYKSANWEAIEEFKEQILAEWRKQPAIGDTEFDTLRRAFEREYKIKGVEEFFETLYTLTYDNAARIRKS